MKANTALGLVFLGVALCLHQRSDLSRKAGVLALISSGLATLIGTLTTLEYATRRDLHIDELLVRDYARTVFSPPGRMGVTTAISLALLGCTLLFAKHRRAVVVNQSIAIAVGGLCIFNLIGYIYGIQNYLGMALYTAMALHSSVTLLILCGGVLCSTADAGFMAPVTSEQLGGVLARRLLPAAVIVPIVLGWLRWQGQLRGYYDTAFGLALFTSANVAVFLALIWAHSGRLNRLDHDRLESRDVTEKRHLEQAQARLLALLEETSDFICMARPDGTILYANRALRRLRGLGDNTPIDSLRIEGTYPSRIVELTVEDAIQAAIQYGAWRGENVFRYHSGEEIPVSQLIMSHRNSDRELEFISTIARDISEIKEKEAQLELIHQQLEASLQNERELARQDPLTGLANRRAFLETSEEEKERSRRYHHCFNIAYIDLDGFKKINDTLGHAVGDQVLRQVAETLRSNLRSTDAVARLGGDEFALLLVETDAPSAEKVLRKLHDLLRAAMKANGWSVDFSIGLASYLCPPASIDNIIRTADGLMYSVKAKGKGNLAVALLA